MHPARLALALAATALGACTAAPDPVPPAATPGGLSVDAYGWISQVAIEPHAFAALMEGGRDGWIALHANDYGAAVSAFGKDDLARARVEWARAIVHDDLSRLSGLVHEQLFTTWETRSGLPPGSVAPAIAALSAYCSGSTRIEHWAAQTRPDQPGHAPTRAAVEGKPPWEASDVGALASWAAAHRAAQGGEPAGLIAAASAPLVTEQAAGFERMFYDPCLHASLSRAWQVRATTSLSGEDWRAAKAWGGPSVGLRGSLFAPWLTGPDIVAEASRASTPGVAGAQAPSVAALGLPTGWSGGDALQPARDEVRAIDATIDGWRAPLLEAADDDGRALLTDLRLLERFRQEWLVTRAREALLADRIYTAGAYVEHARDLSDNRVGPTNSPAVLALAAEIDVRQGRTREALDALQVLSEALPEVVGLRELTGDLAVLQGLDRRGDSKEN